MFLIPIAIAAPMMYGLARGFGTSLLVPVLGVAVLAVFLGLLTVWLARRVLEPAERLEEARRILEDAYDRARSEALRDSPVGSRQPPGIPGGDGARVGDRDPPQPDARAGDPRPRRLQEDQRLARPRGRRQHHPRGRDDDRDLSPPQRPGVPDRWRRIRDHHARDRRRARHARGPPAPRRLPGRGGRRQPDGRSRSRPGSARSRARRATATRSTARPMRPWHGASITAGRA